jgi:DNA-directed RNA polymerase specialized sigma24 family protein
LNPDVDRSTALTEVPVDPEAAAPLVDWTGVLSSLDQGDPVAIARVSRVISAFLGRFRAYELRDSWDDLRQEVLEILIRSHRSGALRHPSAFVSYTGRIVWSRVVLRARRKDRPGPTSPPAPALPDPDLVLDLERALAALPTRERAVVEAIYIRGLDYQAAATELRLPLGTLKRLQTGALRTLRETLGVSRKTRVTAPERANKPSSAPARCAANPDGNQGSAS